MARTLLMSPERVRRTLTRLAYEIVERNRGGETVEVFGIRSRGVALAEAIAGVIAEVEGRAPAVHALDVTPFRDDLAEAPPVEDLDPRPEVEGRDVILVDDVLFTGRTVRAAIDAVLYYGRPASVQLAVLIDRGHREFPIRPDYLGLSVPTKHRERVHVEVEGAGGVYLEE
jgi:pyrimidine operon attenuation protein / uracil phosphoribosyltransferase